MGLSKFALLWFLMTSVIVFIDLTFVLTRPPAGSTAAHPLADHPIFSQWVYYSTFDRRYGSNDDAFVVVQSLCNAAEVVLQLAAVVLHFFKRYAAAHKVALVVSVMTLYKTVMYAMMEHFEHGKYTKHNSTKDLILMVMIPSSFWIIVPLFLIAQSWSKLTIVSAAASSKKKN